MATIDEILSKVIETGTELKDLRLRLYGEESDKGDIPTIRDNLKELNGKVQKHDRFISNLRFIGLCLAAILGGGGGIFSLIKFVF